MKKIITLAVFASILFGCSSSDDNSSSNSMVYDIEMTIKIGDTQQKYVDVYSYNDYQLSQFSLDTPIIETSSSSEYWLRNGYSYGIGNTGILTGSIGELNLKLGQNLASGQIINYGPSSATGSNGPFSFDLGGFSGNGYYFNNVNSTGQVKITSNQNDKLSGEFTFNNLTVYSSSGPNEYASVSGKFKNMPIQ
jgi:hypothetical protein